MLREEWGATAQKLLDVIGRMQEEERDGWVNLAKVGIPLRSAGVVFAKGKLVELLRQFTVTGERPDGIIEINRIERGTAPVYFVRCIRAAGQLENKDDGTKACRMESELVARPHSIQKDEYPELSTKLRSAIGNSQQKDNDGWLDLAALGVSLAAEGVDYKNYGFPKLRPFVEQFAKTEKNPDGVVVLEERKPEPSKPVVCFVRCVRSGEESVRPRGKLRIVPGGDFRKVKSQKMPTPEIELRDWGYIKDDQYRALAQMALEEKWYYGEKNTGRLLLLENYMRYTFKRLCHEGKIAVKEDGDNPGAEYAAFNTGLVNRTYDSIYALFRNNKFEQFSAYWYLVAFAIPGVDEGKTLTRLFHEMPQRADYFEDKIENMLYKTEAKLDIDYPHILLENTSRLPKELLKQVCRGTGQEKLLDVDGIGIDDVEQKEYRKSRKIGAVWTPEQEKCRKYYDELGRRLYDDMKNRGMTYGLLEERIRRALKITKKRVEWNYKTAIPVYYPAANKGALLLPLALVDEDHVDLALVVEWQPQSKRYQGETILPLDIAYCNSRLVTRPDSDWLKLEQITPEEIGEDEDE